MTKETHRGNYVSVDTHAWYALLSNYPPLPSSSFRPLVIDQYILHSYIVEER